MKKINFAIIGFGGIAKTHALAANIANLKFNLPYSLNLTHIVTRRPINLNLLGVENVQNVEEVLKNPDISFVDICTPNSSHFKILNKVVEYNKPVYCEKPLSSKYENSLEMTRLVSEKNLINSVALIYRFMPAIRMIKNEIENKTIGDIIDFKIKLYHKSYLNPNKSKTWRTRKEAGGGALLDLGVHLLDIINFTLGNIEKADIHKSIFFKERTEVDEIADVRLSLENGINGSLEVSRIFAEREDLTTYIIYGTNGSIKMSSASPYTIEIYNYTTNCTQIKSATLGSDILKYYPNERDSLGFFQDCHTASLIDFTNKVYDKNTDSIGAEFIDSINSEKWIK
ncbi:Gfo/Idh/MocA family protein [Clostridium ganghwense]|uniref:Gfo/Idh/MocA family oxidoreductase n=1 Tax=Clostridium ganghwense TaxID=312089 RepID=A0ABT4CLR6_9CLOT|nr:Gfo/Idh/MocA family oxidoreductase [Clostridium ganghwense]MCY6369873.1 Gfo/Idh/MocA family oxidoreductase [Clostridium ganghwense]